MKCGKYSSKSGSVRLLLWFGLMLAGSLALILWVAVFSATDGVATPSAMRWILLGQNLLLFILPALLATALWSTQPVRWLYLDRHISWQMILFAVILALVASPGINLLGYINRQMVLPDCLAGLEQWLQQMEEANMQTTELLLRVDSIGGLLANIGLIGLAAAVGEEFLFRGVVIGLMDRKHRDAFQPHVCHAAIWITAIIFSCIHLQFYGFIPRMLLGALFGYMLVWTRSLWIPIVLHFTNNAAMVILYYIAYNRAWDMDALDNFGTGVTLWAGILSLVITTIGIIYFKKLYGTEPVQA